MLKSPKRTSSFLLIKANQNTGLISAIDVIQHISKNVQIPCNFSSEHRTGLIGSLDSLQIKKVTAGPFTFFQPFRAASDHDPLDFFNVKGFQLAFHVGNQNGNGVVSIN